jgi:hypothetical protein
MLCDLLPSHWSLHLSAGVRVEPISVYVTVFDILVACDVTLSTFYPTEVTNMSAMLTQLLLSILSHGIVLALYAYVLEFQFHE